MDRKILIFALCAGVVSCIYPFEPKGIEQQSGIVVVEGDILAGISSSFTISLSSPVDESSGLTGVRKVISLDAESLYVESEDGEDIYGSVRSIVADKLFAGSKVIYTSNTTDIDITKRHRLVVKLYDDRTYYSEWLSFHTAPPIDSVTYAIAEDNQSVKIFVDAHTDVDSMKYFRWTYLEDWEINSSRTADITYDREKNELIPMTDFRTENRFYCWRRENSSDIILFSTASLSKNIVSKKQIKTIYKDDARLSVLYAIEVAQMTLSKECYSYWDTMLKNNDQTGGLFSQQPNELRGNLLSKENPEEVVLGYIAACKVEKKRIFISRQDAPIYRSKDKCLDTIISNPRDWVLAYRSGFDVVSIDENSGEIFWAKMSCVDCRTRGTKIKPDYWPTWGF